MGVAPLQLGDFSDVPGPVLASLGDGSHKGRGGVPASSCLHIQLPIREDLHVVHGQLQHTVSFLCWETCIYI